MLTFEIKKGEKETAPYVLAHKTVGAIFSCATVQQYKVVIKGSHDGEQYGLIYTDAGSLGFVTNAHYSIAAFDPVYFMGIQYLKFVLDKPAEEDLKFYVHVAG